MKESTGVAPLWGCFYVLVSFFLLPMVCDYSPYSLSRGPFSKRQNGSAIQLWLYAIANKIDITYCGFG